MRSERGSARHGGRPSNVRRMTTATVLHKLPTFDRFIAYRRFGAALAFTNDGSEVLFVSNISGQFNLWRVPVESGWPNQLTSFTDRTVREIAVSPRDGTIVLSADRDGDEFHQLFLLDPEDGWPRQITDEPEVQHYVEPGAFSPDGRKLVYTANARTPADMEVWIRDLETGTARTVFGEGMYAIKTRWSPDGTKLLAADVRHNSDTSIHLIDVETGEASEITPHEEDGLYVPGPWAADGSGFYLLTDEGREYRGLAFYDLTAGRFDWVETPEGDVEEVATSADGRVLAWFVNEDGWEVVRLRDLASGQDLAVPALPAGARPHLTGFRPSIALSNDGSQAAVILTGPRRPPEVWVADTATGKARAVTESRFGVPPENELHDVEPIAYPSFDGREIPAWLYRPHVDGRLPVVLSIHGGPEAQEHPLYHPLYQYLLSRGIAVLATNVRGSTGYGKTYQRLVQRDWGGGDMKDWDHAVKWLHEQEWVDADRLGVYGGSYGGFAVLTCVTRLPDYWAAAVDIFGPSNLITAAKAVPPTWRRMMKRFMGDPEEDAELLRERSPLTYIENVKTPLLVIQGATDPRVVKSESDQLVDKLRSLGREVEYVVFDDEGHGFTKRQNEVRAMQLSAEWLERHLLAAS
jgi:dipeptidyl aminopeptidase/acylaminoacyl peptidase